MKLLNINRIALIRSRAAAEFAQYLLTGANGQYEVSRKETMQNGVLQTRRYSVDLNARRCGCPAFEKEGYCKHCAMCQQEEDNRHYEARAAYFARPIDCEEIDELRSIVNLPYVALSLYGQFTEFHREANRADLTASDRAALHCEYDHLYKHAI